MVLSIRPGRDLAVKKSQTETILTVLLRDFGYRVVGDTILSLDCAWVRSQVVGRCRNIWDAAEKLRPIIADPAYSARHDASTAPST